MFFCEHICKFVIICIHTRVISLQDEGSPSPEKGGIQKRRNYRKHDEEESGKDSSSSSSGESSGDERVSPPPVNGEFSYCIAKVCVLETVRTDWQSFCIED